MPEANEKEAREPDATLLSARDLNCSGQLYPWSGDAPTLPPPGPRSVRMAWAPKLVRRAKGVLRGEMRWPPETPSSSSMALSSTAASDSDELVDMLERRTPKSDDPLPLAPALTGELPDRPMAAAVESESRRRRFWSFMAAEVMGPGKTGVPAETELLRGNRLEKVAEEREPRRLRDMSAALAGDSWLDMASRAEGMRGFL